MKKRLKLMLPLLLILTLVTNATIPALAQPNVVYAAEQPTNPQQGIETPSSIVLGKGTIEINGHLFTDEEFLTFLNNAKIVRIPFENASTFSLGEYDGLVGNSTVAADGLTVLSNAIIGVFQKIAVILDLADLDGFAYLVLGTIDVVSAAGVVSVALALAIKFLPDAIEINGIHIGSFNTALADMTSFFENHKKANPDEEIVNPDPGSGGTTNPGEGSGGSTQPGKDPESPNVKYPGNDPSVAPGEGWEWRGPDQPGGSKGAWFKPETGETLKPDLNHGEPYGPHWDYIPYKNGPQYRLYPDGRLEPKGV